MTVPLCLTIAGSDSGGEAGIQADLQSFSDFNCHGLSATSALTAQNPAQILSVNPSETKCFQDQLKALNDFFEIKYIKTGLLPNISIMESTLKFLSDDAILVTDPLIQSTSGKSLMCRESLNFFKKYFLKRVNFLTPNFPELKILSGIEHFTIEDIPEILGCFENTGIILKGGHSQKPGIDYFYDGKLWKLEAPELKIKSSHGTGCRISSAFCAALAQGNSPLNAALAAKNYVYHALKNCRKTDKGQWLLGSPGKAESLENNIHLSEIT